MADPTDRLPPAADAPTPCVNCGYADYPAMVGRIPICPSCGWGKGLMSSGSPPRSSREETPDDAHGCLPCPFCGNADFSEGVNDINEGVAYTPWYIVTCTQCEVSSKGARLMDDAISLWNCRSALASQGPGEPRSDEPNEPKPGWHDVIPNRVIGPPDAIPGSQPEPRSIHEIARMCRCSHRRSAHRADPRPEHRGKWTFCERPGCSCEAYDPARSVSPAGPPTPSSEK